MGSASSLRLTELLAAVSFAVDLGLGQPEGHVARSAVAAARLNARLDEPTEREALFDIALLGWVGCIADSRDAARWFGDDITYRAGVYDLDMKPLPFLGYLLQHAGREDRLPLRVAKRAGILADRGRGAQESLRTHCLVTAAVARRLGMSELVCAALSQLFARWDGHGLPPDLRGDDIAMPIRIWQLTDVAEVHYTRGGAPAVREVCRDRQGGQFDPDLVDALLLDVDGLFAGTEPDATWSDVLERERGRGPSLPSARLDEALAAVADWVDLKSPWFSGHSRAVADLAAAAAGTAGMTARDVALVRRAGLLHALGRTGVPNTIWDKTAPLTPPEEDRLRLHSFYTDRMLGRVPALAEVGAVAAMAHERLDGTGYHRGLTAPAIPGPARILAAAEAYRTKVEPRPHRAAMTEHEATAYVRAEAEAGRLDAASVHAVLTAAGLPSPPMSTGHGLTAREVEVLGLLARGLTNRQVARRLGIAPKTVGNHVERIYAKAGVSNRAAVTLFAMEHRLV